MTAELITGRQRDPSTDGNRRAGELSGKRAGGMQPAGEARDEAGSSPATVAVRIIARWPEMLTKRDAAAYCSLAIAAFEREVDAGRLPAPHRFGGRDHWRKSQIDAALDAITGDGTGIDKPAWERELEARYGS